MIGVKNKLQRINTYLTTSMMMLRRRYDNCNKYP